MDDLSARLTGSLGWRHAVGDVATTTRMYFVGSDDFTVAGVPVNRDAMVVEAGIALNMGDDVHVKFGYQGEYGTYAQDHCVTANLAVLF